jgi:hypothetical protein
MSININIDGDGLSYTREIDFAQAGRIIAFIGSNSQFGSQLQVVEDGIEPIAPIRKTGSFNLKDLLEKSNAKTYSERITCIGKYIQDLNITDSFYLNDVRDQLKRLGEMPAYFSRDVRSAEDQQYVYCRNRNEEQYEVTMKGVKAVESGFEQIEGQIIKKKKNNNSQRTTAKASSEEIENLIIELDFAGYPNFFTLHTKSLKIIWIIAVANEKGIKALKSSDIEYISSEKLRDRITNNGITALTENSLKNGYIVRTKEGLKIQQRGIDYIKGLAKESN